MVAAGGYDLYKHRTLLSADDLGLFGVGLAVSCLFAFLCIRWLLRYIMRHDFTIFAWYRIAFGLIVLATAHFNLVQWAAP